MRKSSKYNFFASEKRCGQFFIISAVIIVSILVSIAQYLSRYGAVDLTKSQETQELEYISVIKNSLYSTAFSTDCSRLDEDLKDSEKILTSNLAEQGIGLSVSHSIISCSQVLFQFNITSPNFFSKTEFNYP